MLTSKASTLSMDFCCIDNCKYALSVSHFLQPHKFISFMKKQLLTACPLLVEIVFCW